jgi:hypothetical protein
MSTFTQPLVGNSISIGVSSSQWMSIGQVVYHSNGGYYKVADKPSATTVVLINTGYPGNAAPGDTVTNTGSTISPAGQIGPSPETQIDTFVLTSADLVNRYVELSSTPSNLDSVLLSIQDGPVLTVGHDALVTGQSPTKIVWNTTGLAEVISEGDVLIARYSLKYNF